MQEGPVQDCRLGARLSDPFAPASVFWREKGNPVLVNAETIRQGNGNAMTRYPYVKEAQESHSLCRRRTIWLIA